MSEIVLILDRKQHDLWIRKEGENISVIWNVDGVEGRSGVCTIKRKGKIVGIVFGVKEIEEIW